MARVFLDTNVFIDIVEERQPIDISSFAVHQVFISPLSVHILFYAMKRKVPSEKVEMVIEKFYMSPFEELIVQASIKGPTSDFEDNVQLHSAAEADCDFFLTKDKKLLKMKFFGKVRVTEGF